jgi:hypothetical protein
MRPNPVPLMVDRFDMPVEGDDLGLDANLLQEFAGERGGIRLSLTPSRYSTGSC